MLDWLPRLIFKRRAAHNRKHDPSRRQQKPGRLGGNLETFTLFPKLPLKLRRMAWEAALPESRIIDVNGLSELYYLKSDISGPVGVRALRGYDGRKLYYGFLISQLPLLHVNHESRQEMLRRHYTAAFSILDRQLLVYIDFSQEIIAVNRVLELAPFVTSRVRTIDTYLTFPLSINGLTLLESETQHLAVRRLDDPYVLLKNWMNCEIYILLHIPSAPTLDSEI